jgi:hypothetical protein
LSIEIMRLLSSSSSLSRFSNAVSSSPWLITGHSWPLTRIAQQLTSATQSAMAQQGITFEGPASGLG